MGMLEHGLKKIIKIRRKICANCVYYLWKKSVKTVSFMLLHSSRWSCLLNEPKRASTLCAMGLFMSSIYLLTRMVDSALTTSRRVGQGSMWYVCPFFSFFFFWINPCCGPASHMLGYTALVVYIRGTKPRALSTQHCSRPHSQLMREPADNIIWYVLGLLSNFFGFFRCVFGWTDHVLNWIIDILALGTILQHVPISLHLR
jgi:hypothetical protein